MSCLGWGPLGWGIRRRTRLRPGIHKSGAAPRRSQVLLRAKKIPLSDGKCIRTRGRTFSASSFFSPPPPLLPAGRIRGTGQRSVQGHFLLISQVQAALHCGSVPETWLFFLPCEPAVYGLKRIESQQLAYQYKCSKQMDRGQPKQQKEH